MLVNTIDPKDKDPKDPNEPKENENPTEKLLEMVSNLTGKIQELEQKLAMKEKEEIEQKKKEGKLSIQEQIDLGVQKALEKQEKRKLLNKIKEAGEDISVYEDLPLQAVERVYELVSSKGTPRKKNPTTVTTGGQGSDYSNKTVEDILKELEND